jgi:chaperonin GroEL
VIVMTADVEAGSRTCKRSASTFANPWPARQIAANAGADGSVVVAKILDANANGFGFDAKPASLAI